MLHDQQVRLAPRRGGQRYADDADRVPGHAARVADLLFLPRDAADGAAPGRRLRARVLGTKAGAACWWTSSRRAACGAASSPRRRAWASRCSRMAGRGEFVWTDRAVAGEMETYAFGRRGTRGNVVVELEEGERARLLVVVERRGIVAETIVDLGPEDRLAKAEYALDGAQPAILMASVTYVDDESFVLPSGVATEPVRRAAAARGPPATGPSNAVSEAPNVMFKSMYTKLTRACLATAGHVYMRFFELPARSRGGVELRG